jgi:LacI family transcriptional regulator
MNEARLEVDEGRVVHGRHPSAVWRSMITEYLDRKNPPTALFTAQNFITIGAAQALHDLDLHGSIAQIGFDDVDLADVIRPGISVVPQHPRDLGKRAAELMFARLAGSTAPFVREIVPASIIERGSGEIPPYR